MTLDEIIFIIFGKNLFLLNFLIFGKDFFSSNIAQAFALMIVLRLSAAVATMAELARIFWLKPTTFDEPVHPEMFLTHMVRPARCMTVKLVTEEASEFLIVYALLHIILVKFYNKILTKCT